MVLGRMDNLWDNIVQYLLSLCVRIFVTFWKIQVGAERCGARVIKERVVS